MFLSEYPFFRKKSVLFLRRVYCSVIAVRVAVV